MVESFPGIRLCESKLSLSVLCDGLSMNDLLSSPDTFAVLYLDSRTYSPDFTHILLDPHMHGNTRCQYPSCEKIGTTEKLRGVAEHRFATNFVISYFFERQQVVRIDLYARYAPSSFQTHLGSAEFEVPQLARRGSISKLLNPVSGSPSSITLVAERVVENNEHISFFANVYGFRYPGRCQCIKFKPPLQLNVLREEDNLQVSAERAEGVGVSRNFQSPERDIIALPRWILVFKFRNTCEVDDQLLDFGEALSTFSHISRSNLNTLLRFELALSGRQRVLGFAETTLGAWLNNPDSTGIPFTHAQSRNACMSDRNSMADAIGTLKLEKIRLLKYLSMSDYIRRGYEIAFMLAVDFTASNGDPNRPDTLHFKNQNQYNEYERVISSVGRILALYDSDGKIPAYGFGAELGPNFSEVSHCFPLNGKESATCDGLQGVLDAYRNVIHNIRFSGDTHFAEVIRAAISHTEEAMRSGAKSYTILLIITDGLISDVQETISEIVRASNLPISIVIAGVGKHATNFKEMRMLDGDDTPIHPDVKRDIVQFVPYRQFADYDEMLAAEVLKEIPSQFMEYMSLHNIYPPSS